MSDIIRDLQLPRCPRPHPGLPPAPRAAPHPFVLPPPRAGPGRLHPPARRPRVPNLRRLQLGPRAACKPGSGPAGSATGDWPDPALPASYLPRLGHRWEKGRSWAGAGRRVPRAVREPLGSGPGRVNPFAAASRRSHPRSTPQPPPPPPARPASRLPSSPPLPPGAQPPVPARHCAGAARSRLGSRGGEGTLPEAWKLGRAASPAQARGAQGGSPARPGLPGPSPIKALQPRAYLPESLPLRAGFDPAVGAGRRSAAEARAAGGRAASAPGRGPGRDRALLSGLDFSASTQILPRLSRPIRCCSATT